MSGNSNGTKPEIAKRLPLGTSGRLLRISDKRFGALLKAPHLLAEAEQARDIIQADYDEYVSGLAVDAMGAAIFPGKGENEKRVATNDYERKLAVEFLVHNEDETLRKLRRDLDAAQRDVTLARNQMECLQLAARLLIHRADKGQRS